MWIRSQDRKEIIDTHNIFYEDGKVACYDNHNEPTVLGVYSNEERCLEVLDDIVQVKKHNKFIEIVMPLPSYDKVELMLEYVYTYQMPKE